MAGRDVFNYFTNPPTGSRDNKLVISGTLDANGTEFTAKQVAKSLTGIVNEVVVTTVDDFPIPLDGVIYLADKTAYLIDGDVSIGENRIVCADNNAIYGLSPEISILHSTLDTEAMITSQQSITCYSVSFYVAGTNASILDLDATLSPDANNAIDWQFVNFLGGHLGNIIEYSNIVMSTIGLIDRTDEGFPALGDGFFFGGSTSSIVFTDSLFTIDGSSNSAVTLSASLTLLRRFRATDCALIVTNAAIGLDLVVGATIDPEGLMLIDCNFAGGGTYLNNIDYTDDRARFEGCRGIQNTYAAAQLTMTANAVATTAVLNTPIKIAGDTTGQAITQKFDVATIDNRAVYNGALSRLSKITAILSLTSGNNNDVAVYIAKNGVVIGASTTALTTSAGGRLDNATCQTLSALATDDYFEVWVENKTATVNITVEELSLVITEIG
tara:strand:- start:39 stop:1361 length:1323 start_codon:yes stop_codon:yes gene_type:complete